MKRFTLLLLMAFLGLNWAIAQTTVKGTVTAAEDGSAIPGATVAVKGFSGVGTITDFDGSYTIKVPEGATTLVVSFVGYSDQEVAVNGTTINVALKRADVGLEEIVVVAYGTQTKRATTGAITSVGSETIENQIAVSPLGSIQGAAAGVNVITTGGQPGENPTIRIRGIGSVNASADPLVVVDGVVFSGNINSIGSDQIESINVLKDASATSLYGSRASNGVILITTKGGGVGKERKSTVTVNSKVGFSSPAVKNYDLVGAEKAMMYTWEALRNSKLYVDENPLSAADAAQFATDNLVSTLGYNPYTGTEKPIGTDGKVASGAQLAWDTDWFNELMREQAYFNEHSIGVEGGTKKISYYFNGSYLSQDGAIIESNFERYTGRFNIKAQLNDWLEMGTNSSYSQSTQNYPSQDGSGYTNGMQWVNSVSNIFPLYSRDDNGDFILDANDNKIYDFGNRSGLINATRPIFGGDNAIASTQNHSILYTRTNLFSTNYLKIKFTDNLSFRSTFGYENYLLDSNEYTHYKYGHAGNVGGRVSQERNSTITKTFVNGLNYNNEFGDHKINVDVISEIFDLEYDELVSQGTGFLPGVKVLAGSTVPEYVGGFVNSRRLVSYMGRGSYGFKSKYFVDLSARRDASSQFLEGNRWGTFYSVGGSWIISDENFIPESIDLLKLRVSFGELGNNSGIGYFPYLSAYETGWNNNSNTGVYQGAVADKNITWEKSGLFNAALDFGLFNNRLTGTVEYYRKSSIDLIFDKPLAPSSGDQEITTNAGSMVNSGFELILNSVNVHTDDIYWTSSFNISTNKNELTELPQEEIFNGTKKWMVGRSVYDFFIRDYAGVDPQNGDALWYKDIQEVDGEGNPVFDANGKPVLTGEKVTTNDYDEASRYYVGSALPDFTGGFSTYFKYKGFDINVMFNFSYGSKIYDFSYAGLMNTGNSPGDQWTTDIANRWQQPGDITDVPKLTSNNNLYTSTSSRFLFDNNYLRLRALTIGYNLPESLLAQAKISSLRVFAQAGNLWTWQSHKGLDPEQSYAGTTDNRSNGVKTITMGLNLKF